MKKTALTLVFAALAAGSVVAEDKIVVKGSDTLGAKMVPQLAEVYKSSGNEVNFEIAAEGSSTAFTTLMAGTADIGMSSRDIKTEEKDGFTAKGMKIEEHVAGYDMIAVIVNKSNPVKGLTLKQVEGIFTGDIKDWGELGAKPGPLSVYTRNTSSGTYASFQKLAMNKRDYGSNGQKMAGNEQIAQEVGKNPNGVGYVGLAYAGADGVKAVEVDKVAAVAENASKYPIARTLFYYTIGGKTSEAAAKFLEWTKTDAAAQKVVERVGFIPPAS